MALPSWSIAIKLFNCFKSSRPLLNKLYKNESEKEYFNKLSNVQCKNYSRDINAEKCATNGGPGLNQKKKKVFIPRVTLLTEDNELTIVTLEMAEKIANRRNLKLVKIVDFDTKTERPTYKLMTTKDYLQEGLERKKAKKLDKDASLKAEKIISISSKIGEHDLITKIKSASKLLAKKHEVRIFVSADGNKEKAAAIGAKIEEAVKELPINVKKNSSGGNVKIYMQPIINPENKQTSDKESKKDKTESSVADAS